MEKHIKSYLSGTSAHGFRYLVGEFDHYNVGFPAVARVVWTGVIIFSFVTSGIMITTSIQDNNDNPIPASFDYVPIQESVYVSNKDTFSYSTFT